MSIRLCELYTYVKFCTCRRVCVTDTGESVCTWMVFFSSNIRNIYINQSRVGLRTWKTSKRRIYIKKKKKIVIVFVINIVRFGTIQISRLNVLRESNKNKNLSGNRKSEESSAERALLIRKLLLIIKPLFRTGTRLTTMRSKNKH